MATPFMGLTVPVPGTTGGIGVAPAGADYATDVSNDMNIIDSHDHINVGQKIQTAAISINADLGFNSYNAFNFRSVRFASQPGNIAAAGDIGCLYMDGSDLWYNNGTGSQIQLTSGSIIASSVVPLSHYVFLVVAGNHTISSSDAFQFFATNTSTAITYTLPTAVSVAAGTYYIIKDGSGLAATNNITINTVSTDLIDGVVSYVISDTFGSVIIVSDGSANWNVLKDDAISLQHNAVSSAAPSLNNLLTWNGSAWAPIAPATVTSINGATVPDGSALTAGNVLQATGTSLLAYGPINLAGGANYVSGLLPTANQTSQSLFGDLTGSTASGTVIGLQGVSVANTAPTNGQVLTYNSGTSSWAPAVITAGSVTLGGDVTGAASANTVVAIQGNTVPAGALTKGQFLVATGTGQWAPTTISGDATASASTPGSLTVVALQGRSISPSGPADGQVLTWKASDSKWEPLTLPGGAVTLTGDVTGPTSSNTVGALQGNTVAAGALTKGQFLVATGTGQWAATTLSGDVSESAATPGSLTVNKINGASVQAAGSLIPGKVLQVTGVSTLIYAAVNLAGGSSFVTGSLPVGNQAHQTMGGDVSGTTAAATVVALQSNTVAAGSLTKGQFLVATGTSQWMNTALSGDVTGSASTPGLLTVGAIQGNTVTSGALTKGQFLVSSSTSNWAATTLSGDITESATTPGLLSAVSLTGDGTNINVATSGGTVLWNKATLGPTIKQADNTTASAIAANLTLQAQNATGGSSAVGGDLNLTAGSGNTNGSVHLQTDSISLLSVGSAGVLYGVASGGNLASATTGTITLSASQYKFPVIQLGNQTLSGNITIVFPAGVVGQWIVDIGSLAANAHSVLLKANGNTSSSIAAFGAAQIYISVSGSIFWTGLQS